MPMAGPSRQPEPGHEAAQCMTLKLNGAHRIRPRNLQQAPAEAPPPLAPHVGYDAGAAFSVAAHALPVGHTLMARLMALYEPQHAPQLALPRQANAHGGARRWPGRRHHGQLGGNAGGGRRIGLGILISQ